MAEITLQEYLSTAQRGMLNRIFGPEYLLKQTYLQQTNIFTQTFGRRVWDAMNNRTVLYNAIRKVGWGPTFGWRLRTDRGTGNSYAVTETGSLPTIDVSNYVNVGSAPKFPATTFGVSIKAQFMGGLEGGIGDALAVEQEAKMRDHIKIINEGLCSGDYAYINAYNASAAPAAPAYPASATTYTRYTVLPAGAEKRFKIGDTVGFTDNDNGTSYETANVGGGVMTVVAIDETTHYVFVDLVPVTMTPAQGDIIYVLGRVTGITSVPDICCKDGTLVAGGTNKKINPDVFNLTTRNATTYAYASAASVDDNSGTARDITLKCIDDAIDGIRTNGGLMGLGLIATGHSQYSSLDRLLQSQQRYLGYGTFQFGVGDERTYPGTQVGMELASYRGIPILPDADIPKSMSSAGVALGHDVFILDLDHLEIAVGIATQYFENQNYFVANALVIQGLLFTALELRARRIDVHAAVLNLNS